MLQEGQPTILEVKGLIPAETKVSLFFWNECEQEINACEDFVVEKDGDLSVGYGECNNASVNRKSILTLKGEGSKGVCRQDGSPG